MSWCKGKSGKKGRSIQGVSGMCKQAGRRFGDSSDSSWNPETPSAEEFPVEEWDEVLNVNLTSVFFFARRQEKSC